MKTGYGSAAALNRRDIGIEMAADVRQPCGLAKKLQLASKATESSNGQ